MAHVEHFRRELLPPASSFWRQELSPRRLSRPSRGWARTSCPFHGGENRTAFSVNVDNGAFYCFNCGVKGGDLVAYVMVRDRVDFKTAAQSLNAWEQVSDPHRIAEIKQAQRERERIHAAKLAKQEAATEARRAALIEIRLYERTVKLAGRTLDQRGPDAEAMWQLMADATELLNRLQEEHERLELDEDELGIYHDPTLRPVVPAAVLNKQ